MKYLAWLLVLLAGACSCLGAQASQTSSPTKTQDECSISGTVVALVGSQPLHKARIFLMNLEDPRRRRSVASDENGRFQLKGIGSGRYSLTVSRNGYVSQSYGQRGISGPGSSLTLRPGQQLKDLVFRMVQSAVITGRIFDEDGEPLAGVSVSADQQSYVEGKRMLSPSSTDKTNDLGEFRLYGLDPGRYVISAAFVITRWTGLTGADPVESETDGYAKVYYPGTEDGAKATPITLKAGDEIPSVEFYMRKARTYRVRGHVAYPPAAKPVSRAGLELVPKAAQRGYNRLIVSAAKDGAFEFVGVSPGSYILNASAGDDEKTFTGRTPVEVTSEDTEGVTVTVASGSDIAGRIVWDGPPQFGEDRLDVWLEPTDPGGMFMWNPQNQPKPDNTFLLKYVSDGNYRVELNHSCKSCYIKAVKYGGADGLEDGFNVTHSAPATLEVTLSSRGAAIQGTATDADGLPASGVYVVLAPNGTKRRQQDRLFRQGSTDQYGHFEMKGISPGDYKLFCWTEVESGAWEDPEFLKLFEEKGQSIQLQDDDRKTVTVIAIPNAAAENSEP